MVDEPNEDVPFEKPVKIPLDSPMYREYERDGRSLALTEIVRELDGREPNLRLSGYMGAVTIVGAAQVAAYLIQELAKARDVDPEAVIGELIDHFVSAEDD